MFTLNTAIKILKENNVAFKVIRAKEEIEVLNSNVTIVDEGDGILSVMETESDLAFFPENKKVLLDGLRYFKVAGV